MLSSILVFDQERHFLQKKIKMNSKIPVIMKLCAQAEAYKSESNNEQEEKALTKALGLLHQMIPSEKG